MKKTFIGCYNKSVILTYVGIAFAIFGLNTKSVKTAVLCLIISGICDLFDGKVARMCKRTDEEKNFGIQIDSLADVIAALILPVAILNKVCSTSDTFTRTLCYAVSLIYVLSGVTRLAWFNITTTGTDKYFQGFPVWTMTLLNPILFIIFGNSEKFVAILLISYMITAFLFVLNMPIKKPKGKDYAVLSFIEILIIISVILK